MDWMFWAAQAVSVAATCCTVGSFQCRSNDKLLLWQGVFGGILWTLHFALLGAWAACLSNSIAIFRAFAVRRMYRRGTPDYGMLVLVTLLMAGAAALGAVLGWNGSGLIDWVPLWVGRVVCVLMVVCNIATTLAAWSKNGTVIRLVQLGIGSPVWLANNFITFSVFGVITEVFNMVSVIVSLARYGLHHKGDS